MQQTQTSLFDLSKQNALREATDKRIILWAVALLIPILQYGV